mmetsp:Transcript_10357/g.16897  ORF Transcript_10357/g.16897 Transcript_10357/m.16897 type:complete len:169 (-) Transcript_10357:141-647(-)|eukprot:CAMPEP_0184661478 /NCGR_PEP_ID=MMETSP0308-20130426/38591_1 /TAXON_ID=38269 /ORGANISM="Gloeochaete witrockiana, Strain SAG 46.84" /LENGTH=168 /DNA_ID=CAMNT_0027102813 /DNA_START=47 /DNA_END=553 /DNA_ORIENTATION=+
MEKQEKIVSKLFRQATKGNRGDKPEKAPAIRPGASGLQVQNVCGSTAGAGSGDFHQYRQMRRKELFREAKLEDDWVKKSAQEEFEQTREMKQKEIEAKTAKKREKRKKKQAKDKAKKDAVKKAKITGSDGQTGDSQANVGNLEKNPSSSKLENGKSNSNSDSEDDESS